MAQLMEYAEYLSKEIGPRPAGTEEEQQAALYITEQIQKESGFTANIEEFSGTSNTGLSRAILAGVLIVVTILAIIFPAIAIPAFIVAAAAAVVYALEEFGRPILSRVLPRGASQNVIAKYQPNFDTAEDGGRARVRSRKVVLVAHYDSGRVTPSLVSRVESTGAPMALVCLIAMIVAAFFQLLRVFVAPGGGMGLLVLNVLTIISLIVCALPIVRAILMNNAAYNEGANNNATGTAALIEIARRISRGSVSEADLAQNADEQLHIHGEAAAREAGLIPEGAQIRYEAEQLTPPSELGDYDEESRLLAAKAAIAALTGKPVERRVYGSVADKLVNSFADGADEPGMPAPVPAPEQGDDPVAVSTSAAQVAAGPASFAAPSGSAEGFENAPSWFVAAQQNAKRPDDPDAQVQVQRSKYTEAMEYADRTRAERAEEARAAEKARAELELRLREQAARAAVEAAQLEAEHSAPAPAPSPTLATTPAPAPAPSPDSTIAMPAPIPSADVVAEAVADDIIEAPVSSASHAARADARKLAVADIPSVTPEPEPEPASRNRIANLPSIDSANPAGASAPALETNPSRSGLMRRLRNNVPSLSGLIDPVGDDAQPQGSPSTPNTSAAAANRTAARRSAAKTVPSVVNVPSPVEQSDPALEPVDYNMEVPRSRSGNLLGRLQGKSSGDDLVDTPQEWLNLDDDFEVMSAGRARGGWESFRDDQYFDDDDDFGDFASGDDDRPSRRRWQGGAYSRKQLGHVNMRSGEDSDADTIVPENLPDNEIDPTLTGEIEQIYHFRNPQFNTEVWFVALGADEETHDGARAFLEEHAEELRGAMVIEIESLGAGTLSVATEEGRVRKLAASSRVKRFTRNAQAATGIAVDSVSLAGSDSIASVIQRAGYQSMHLFGAENGRPALKGSADDILENIDELLFDDHVNFVFELLKQ